MKTSAQGMVFEVESATPDTWLEIGHINTYANNPGSPTIEDETTFASTYVEKRAGLPDPGNTQLDGFWDMSDVGQARLYEHQEAVTTAKIRQTYPNGVIRTSEGYVTGIPDSGQANGGSVKATMNLELTGPIVFS